MKKRRFMGVPFEGILHQKAQRVDAGNTRGIIFDRPERHIVNTPFGQMEICAGDWVIELRAGSRYVIKDAHIHEFFETPKKWWKIW